ncbi:DUF6249 domain-containing protein [Mangrovibacterium marinum]|uniref:DUF6249 domain-containing protein n=1 Tax=Mangrovibacterium marinum TaxID=1639118 RepID=A0A2T5BZ24_9BACT|nr:DUF6249 domain-containing protein [Mangrovibacterium marinum]PTN07517.1 hypothetical protein C8N47_11642 [Mangrovibacterium marinum]
MLEDILIPISFFAFIFASIYIHLTTRNKERMAMIEKGADPSLFKSKAGGSMFFTLKAGLLFIGVAIGVLFGSLLANAAGMDEGTAYVSMIFLFGGIALVIGYRLQSKKQE